MSLVTTSIEDTRLKVKEARVQGMVVGLVPTMGALHEGHISLIRAARRETGFVATSIFVNPAQFGPKEDLQQYPRPFEADVKACREEGVDLVFAPDLGAIYPLDFRTFVEVKEWQEVLCGASRPGHFRGVATVVLKLFNIVQPDVAYFGQKDYQQALIIRQMASDLNVPVRLRICPIIRAADGLALSSRNQYLDPHQRRQAPVLHEALEEARALVHAGERDASVIQQAVMRTISAASEARIDYVAVVDAETLQPLDSLKDEILVAVAVKFGTTRLIDNTLIRVE